MTGHVLCLKSQGPKVSLGPPLPPPVSPQSSSVFEQLGCFHYCFLLYRSGICTALIIVPRLDLHGSIIIYMMVRKSKLNNIINYTDGILAIEQHNSVHVYNNTGIL